MCYNLFSNEDKIVHCKICGQPYRRHSEGSKIKGVCLGCFFDLKKKNKEQQEAINEVCEYLLSGEDNENEYL